jgi:uncharacterized protein
MLLADAAPELARLLKRNVFLTAPRYSVADIRCETVFVTMRDGTRLATDLYLPPELPAPAIAMRTPYARDRDGFVGVFMSFARRGYVAVSQDCRGTGKSEPDSWDYYMYEPEDGYDFVEWASRQDWYDGFIGSCGSSYTAQTQWQMATHPRMSTIAPEMSGLGVAANTAHLYMYLNAYSRSVGKGVSKVAVPSYELEGHMLAQTLAGGYFNDPPIGALPAALLERYPQLGVLSPPEAKAWLWQHYCSLPCAGRADFVKRVAAVDNVTAEDIEGMTAVFGQRIPHDAHTLPHVDHGAMSRSLHAPALMITGWYDWGLNDALATWALLSREAREPVRSGSRLLITPSAHNLPGYHEGAPSHPELQRAFITPNQAGLLLSWYEAARSDKTDSWPRVVYYLMGANEWRADRDWPPPEAKALSLYLGANGTLSIEAPRHSDPDRYVFDPEDPAPTVGGSILSFVYPPGSVDVSDAHRRPDVLTYTTDTLDKDLDVVGPLRLILHASSSAVDTDFSARLCDVFPDGRAIQLQSGILRARHRNSAGEPELLEPGLVYRLEIDMWATANRFKAGHRLRLDISSSDFPRFDRNTNRGGEPGPPLKAAQAIYHDPDRPSHLLVWVLQ